VERDYDGILEHSPFIIRQRGVDFAMECVVYVVPSLYVHNM
jgi:hypothetical protein